MKLTKTAIDDWLEVVVTGCLDTAVANDFNQELGEIAAATKGVRFDFSGVEFVASSCLRSLVSLAKRLNPGGGRIEIVGANEVVRDVLEMTGLVEVFDVR